MEMVFDLDEDLLRTAQEYCAVRNASELVNEALKALIEREAARRLAALGGTMPDLGQVPRLRVGDI
jgi:Arc/MetJ family transcription regulator